MTATTYLRIGLTASFTCAQARKSRGAYFSANLKYYLEKVFKLPRFRDFFLSHCKFFFQDFFSFFHELLPFSVLFLPYLHFSSPLFCFSSLFFHFFSCFYLLPEIFSPSSKASQTTLTFMTPLRRNNKHWR